MDYMTDSQISPGVLHLQYIDHCYVEIYQIWHDF